MPYLATISQLQWSHSQIAVETIFTVLHMDTDILASMGPRHNSRGNTEGELKQFSLCWMLQWGHGYSAMERYL